jgi:ATP-dependent DNA helicase PIF1
MNEKKPRLESSEELSSEQQQAFDIILEGKNLFYSGNAGSGKSFLLKIAVDELRDRKKNVCVTSSTGSSALNIGGTTVHSFAGIGLGSEDVDELIQKVNNFPAAKKRWNDTQVLFIDEISMIGASLFDKLDQIGRAVRRKPDLPFGGIQLVVSGDFFQLKPVELKGEWVQYAFEGDSWKESVQNVMLLKKVIRQKEPALIDGLNEMRHGKVSQSFIDLVTKDKAAFYKSGNGVLPSRLMSRNKDVDAINILELNKLKTETVTFNSVDSSTDKKYDDAFPVPKEVTIAMGAQVVLLKNCDGYVNGSRGVVKSIDYVNDIVEVQGKDGTMFSVMPKIFEIYQNGKIIATRTAFPIKLAFALSIHRSQGSSIDYLDVDLEGVFSPAQAYVALSRATCLSGLRVTGLSTKVVYCDPVVVEYYKELEKGNL